MKASEEKKKKMREYAKTHRKQFNEYQRKYINKLKEEGRKIPTTNYKSRIDKAIEYIEDRFKIDKQTGGYHLTHTFDSSNLLELYDILKGSDKE